MNYLLKFVVALQIIVSISGQYPEWASRLPKTIAQLWWPSQFPETRLKLNPLVSGISGTSELDNLIKDRIANIQRLTFQFDAWTAHLTKFLSSFISTPAITGPPMRKSVFDLGNIADIKAFLGNLMAVFKYSTIVIANLSSDITSIVQYVIEQPQSAYALIVEGITTGMYSSLKIVPGLITDKVIDSITESNKK